MTDRPDEPMLEPTQADRDAAAESYLFVQRKIKTPHAQKLQERTVAEMRRGRWDKDESVQAFARHARAALTAGEVTG